MKTLIFIGGIYNVFFALFHSGFWKLWDWDNELSKLTPLNSGIMQVLNVHIIYYLIFTAVICFAFPKELVSTRLGKGFLFGTAMFWLLRTVLQFVFLKVDDLVTYALTVLLLFGAVLFLIPVFRKTSGQV